MGITLMRNPMRSYDMARVYGGFTDKFERMKGVLHTAVSAQYSNVGLVEKARIYSDFLYSYQVLEIEDMHEHWDMLIRYGRYRQTYVTIDI